ncbi:hypothetical protein [Thermococcus sp. 5-4]|uniref:hypothetical protein n=1 Tax=Thermococcus sp. 5-4 TaxID=2008440 RepID=UPI000B49A920|nr:hypothetical protein [Thermococcus sp. 5-4]ASA77347.1 hypothetical protein CDI07_03250 [Thermococcus sp. 5-4]
MRRYLVLLFVLVLLGGMLGAAYAVSQPPSRKALASAMGSMNKYQFVREIEFDQYRVYVINNGGSNVLKKDFEYHGKVVTTGAVDMVRGVVTESEEYYINGSLAMHGQITVNLLTGEVSGTVTLADGTTMDVKELWEKYYGVDSNTAVGMIRGSLPTLAFRDALLNSRDLREVKSSVSLSDRILMGLGLKEKLFEYEFTTKSGKTWHVFVDSSGVPRRFEFETEDSKIVVHITPMG